MKQCPVDGPFRQRRLCRSRLLTVTTTFGQQGRDVM